MRIITLTNVLHDFLVFLVSQSEPIYIPLTFVDGLELKFEDLENEEHIKFLNEFSTFAIDSLKNFRLFHPNIFSLAYLRLALSDFYDKYKTEANKHIIDLFNRLFIHNMDNNNEFLDNFIHNLEKKYKHPTSQEIKTFFDNFTQMEQAILQYYEDFEKLITVPQMQEFSRPIDKYFNLCIDNDDDPLLKNPLLNIYFLRHHKISLPNFNDEIFSILKEITSYISTKTQSTWMERGRE
jgi:hypothetical protein